MDQTVINATESFLRDELAKATLRNSDLELMHSSAVQRSTQLQLNFGRMQTALESWTKEELSNESITEEQAHELAKIGDFSLARTYDVTVTVEHTFTVEVPADETIEDVLESVSYNLESYGVDVMHEDSNVVDSNWEEVS
jgi:hypothetical protein